MLLLAEHLNLQIINKYKIIVTVELIDLALVKAVEPMVISLKDSLNLIDQILTVNYISIELDK